MAKERAWPGVSAFPTSCSFIVGSGDSHLADVHEARMPGQDSCSLLRLRTLSKASTARKASSAAAFTSVIVGCNCRKYCHARSSYILEPVSLLMATTIANRVSPIESLFGHFDSESQKAASSDHEDCDTRSNRLRRGSTLQKPGLQVVDGKNRRRTSLVRAEESSRF